MQNGLEADGILGPQTLQALNISAVQRVRQIVVNMERWRKIRSTLTGSDFTAQTVKLSEPVNIHILYWTVWVGKDDRIYFSPDIYDRDTALDTAMQEPPPGA